MHSKKPKQRYNDRLLFPVGKKLSIHLLLLLVLAVSVLGRYHIEFLIAYGSALLHESAHIIAARILKVPIARVEMHPFGVCAKLNAPSVTPKKEFLIAAAGPFFSLLLALLLERILKTFPISGVLYAMRLNFALALLNLLPALPLDGGRILKSLLSAKSGIVKAYNFTLKISQIIIAFLLIMSVFLLLTADFNFSLLLIGVFLLGNLSAEQKNISVLAMRELAHHKEKLYKNDINKVKCIAMYEDLPARKALRHFSSNYYYIIHIIDHRMHILRSVTETQLIDALILRSIRLRVKDI